MTAPDTLSPPAEYHAGMHSLHALEALLRRFDEPGETIRCGGHVDEVTATHLRINGLSRSARLGDVVDLQTKR
ncbi:MAG: hypothetical protein KDJ43_03690, partial [Rhizobiaceae bacterium]|nr:hypothetical protein [Rhizobiaceae bacterium]